MKFHKFFQKQIDKHLPKDVLEREEIQRFLSSVNENYMDYEKDLEISANAFDISEEEYLQVNKNLSELIQKRNQSFENIKTAIERINPELSIEESDDIIEISNLLNSEIKKSEQLEKLNRKILESALNAVIYFNIQGKIKFLNEQALKIFGYEEQELRNLNFLKLFSEPCQERFRKGFDGFIKTGNDQLFNSIRESVGVTQKGKEIFLELYIIPIEREDKMMFCAFILDKTESILSNRQLKAQEERYRNMINNINLGLVEVDNEENVLFCNQVFSNISGYKLEEIEGRNLSEILSLSIDSQQLMNRKLKERVEGKSDQYEIMVKNKNGEVKWWVISGSPVYNKNNEVVGSIGIHLDVTDRKNLENKLLLAKENAEKNVDFKESILTTMSHEIRTPLNGILGMLREMDKQVVSEEIKKQLDYSIMASEHLMTIVNNILDYSKLQEGKMLIKRKPARLEDSIDKVLQILKSKIQEKNLEVEVYSTLNDSYLFDNIKIEQILFNVIGNAIKFTDKGTITIKSSASPITKKLHNVIFSISDTGIGMSPKTLDSLFTKYSQGSSFERGSKGTGLGMAITKELTELKNGKIEVESQKGKGSTFTFEFEFKVFEGVIKKDEQESIDTSFLKDQNVLIVDDNEMNRIVAQNVLEKTGARLWFAEDAKSTFELIHNHSFDLLLLDLFLPDKNGNEITRILRNEYQMDIPIIGMSANINQRYIDDCMEAGMNKYLHKPYNEYQLLQIIAREMNKEEKLYDLHNLLEMSRGDDDFIQKMIRIFVENTEESLPKIRSLAEKNEVEMLQKVIHKLKPSVMMMRIEKAIPIILQLEEELGNTQIIDDTLIKTIEILIQSLEEAILQMLKKFKK